jgi:hypothetical protein
MSFAERLHSQFVLFYQWYVWNPDAESCTRYKLTYIVVYPLYSICETHTFHTWKLFWLFIHTGKYEMTFLVQQSFSQRTRLVGVMGINFWQGTKKQVQWTLMLWPAWHTNSFGYDQNFNFDLWPKSWVTTQMPVKAKTCIRLFGCKQRPEMHS